MLYEKTKRTIDLVVSMTALVFLAPLILMLSLTILLNMGGPVVFRQFRPGLRGRPFEMYKFRTMIDPSSNIVLSDEARITSLGRFLRGSSLDELPELLNVVRGNMSLVGPRPLLMEYLEKYTPTQMRRHDVLPGITGLAQVRGRNNLSWRHKFKYDLFYVEKRSLLFDLRIIIETIAVVFLRTGFRPHGEPTKFGQK
jgi:sugar transferase EpsL